MFYGGFENSQQSIVHLVHALQKFAYQALFSISVAKGIQNQKVMQDLAGEGGGGEVYYERYKNGVLTGELDIGIYGPVICLLTQQMSQQKESI